MSATDEKTRTDLTQEDTDFDQPTEHEKRLRSLTEKGLESYVSKCAKYGEQLRKSTERIETLSAQIPDCINSRIAGESLANDLNVEYNQYRLLSSEYRAFLDRANTQQSKEDLSSHSDLESKYSQLAETAISQLLSVKLESVSRTSQHHRSPAGSVHSSKVSSKISSVITMKRAEAAAARARLEFAKKETELRKQQAQLDEQEIMAKANTTRLKAELDAQLDLLTHQKVVAAAEAEAQALEVSERGNLGPLLGEAEVTAPFDPTERTKQYVIEQAAFKDNAPNQDQIDQQQPSVPLDIPPEVSQELANK